ncbi:MAG: hypothetical protein R3F43_05640 [bacterium]
MAAFGASALDMFRYVPSPAPRPRPLVVAMRLLQNATAYRSTGQEHQPAVRLLHRLSAAAGGQQRPRLLQLGGHGTASLRPASPRRQRDQSVVGMVDQMRATTSTSAATACLPPAAPTAAPL